MDLQPRGEQKPSDVQLRKGPSLPDLFKRRRHSDQGGSSTGTEEETLEPPGGKKVRSSHQPFVCPDQEKRTFSPSNSSKGNISNKNHEFVT